MQNLRTRLSHQLYNRIWDELARFGHTSVMRQNLKLDLGYFETSKFYDQFERAIERVDVCLPRIFSSSTEIISSLVGFLSVIILLFSFHWSLFFVVILMLLPTLFLGMSYSITKHGLGSYRIPEARKAAYLADLVGDRSDIKEIKLFGLGKNLLSRYLKFYDRVIEENLKLGQKQFRGAF